MGITLISCQKEEPETKKKTGTLHVNIGVLISEKEMDSEFYTLEKLLNHEGVAKFTEWIRKRQPDKNRLPSLGGTSHRLR